MVPQVYSIIACPCIFTGTGFFIQRGSHFQQKTFRGDKMLNLSLDEVKAYAADYTAVPVAKECFADMVTRNR